VSGAQPVLAFVRVEQTSTFSDKKAVLAVAKERPTEMIAPSDDMGTTLGIDGK
jgi:hypothetical protein